MRAGHTKLKQHLLTNQTIFYEKEQPLHQAPDYNNNIPHPHNPLRLRPRSKRRRQCLQHNPRQHRRLLQIHFPPLAERQRRRVKDNQIHGRIKEERFVCV